MVLNYDLSLSNETVVMYVCRYMSIVSVIHFSLKGMDVLGECGKYNGERFQTRPFTLRLLLSREYSSPIEYRFIDS